MGLSLQYLYLLLPSFPVMLHIIIIYISNVELLKKFSKALKFQKICEGFLGRIIGTTLLRM